MKYVSIDIETTGLDPDNCQIIEFGAVIDDMEAPLLDCPTFRYRVKADNYRGEPYALSMHTEFFADMATASATAADCPVGEEDDLIGPEQGLAPCFTMWLRRNQVRPYGFTAAGKNFAEFDARFIRKLPSLNTTMWHHAVLDPGPLYVLPTDEKVPNMKECMARGVGPNGYDIPGKPHTAIYDALVVCALLRERLGTFTT